MRADYAPPTGKRLSASLALVVQLCAVVAIPLAEQAHGHEFSLGAEWHGEHGSHEHGGHALGDCPLLCSLTASGPLTTAPAGIHVHAVVISTPILSPQNVQRRLVTTSITARGPPHA
ncbi:MAG: hypothetical protein AAF389_18615 [Gemmatimonadota bacterium]